MLCCRCLCIAAILIPSRWSNPSRQAAHVESFVLAAAAVRYVDVGPESQMFAKGCRVLRLFDTRRTVCSSLLRR